MKVTRMVQTNCTQHNLKTVCDHQEFKSNVSFYQVKRFFIFCCAPAAKTVLLT